MSLILPADVCLLESQVAGHTIQSVTQIYGMLRNKSGTSVFKPLSKPLYAEREIAFFKQMKDANYSSVQQFIPQYEGHVEMVIDGRKQQFIRMENLTYSMRNPCVIDIKIGRRTWDPLATANKITLEEQKYATCKNCFGLCIPGFQIYNTNGECFKFGKEFGKSLNQTTFFETLLMFFNAQNKCHKPFIKTILNQLYHIQKWSTTQTTVNIFSSSILIAYDCERLLTELKSKKQDCLCYPTYGLHGRIKDDISYDSIPWVKVKMIDFAHVFDSQTESCDSNYLFGLQNLIYMLQQILITN